MTTDPFTEAARKQARWEWDFNLSPMSSTPVEDLGQRMAEWARTHLAAQEPTDAEVLAALNAQGVAVSPKMHPAPSLDYWGDKPAEAMRAALSAAAVLPLIAAEVRKAQADAGDEGSGGRDDLRPNPYSEQEN